jgi:hypothetical protein
VRFRWRRTILGCSNSPPRPGPLGWLTLATAYRDTDFGEWFASDDGYADEVLTRPVISLS